MLKFTIPNKFIDDFSTKDLKYIAEKLYGSDVYSIVQCKRKVGRYITLENTLDKTIHYICFSNPENNSRNARLMEFFSPAYVVWYEDEHVNKYFDIYILNPSASDVTNYTKMIYRCFLTLGIRILNQEQLNLLALSPFSDYSDLKRYRTETSSGNSSNNSTYFTEEADHFSIYGKTFGANSMESFLLSLVIRKLLPNSRLIFYPVVDNSSTDLSVKQKKILQNNNVSFGSTINDFNDNDVDLTDNAPDRDTPKFHYNLLKKYGEKKCLLCGCDIDHLIIGSHIERVADIKRNQTYSDEDKRKKLVDGNNGFWLCANHDKMFEYGIIYFNGKRLVYKSSLNFEQKQFIDNSIYLLQNPNNKTFDLSDSYYNENVRNYLEKHKNRVLTLK